MGSGAVIIAIALAATAVAGPLGSSGPCARQCTESSKFQYNPGTSYFFDYESDAITSMHGTTNEESRLHMKTRVEIHAVSKCDFVMRLSGVSLENSDPTNPRSKRPVLGSDEFKEALERYTLRFSFQDGVVEHVCPSSEESPEVLNIKRGILSVLQTSSQSLENSERVVETDVAGRCTVDYEPLGRGWNSVTVRKIKDLTTCSDRRSFETAIQMNPFTEEVKSKPLVRGSQECQQVFKHNRLESVICTETHVFRPFSRQDGGAMTKVTQALTFNSEKQTAFTGAEFSTLKKAMTFDHEPSVTERTRRTRQVEMTFTELCKATQDDIKPSVPGMFTTFVYGLRQLEYSDLVNMYKRADSICSANSKAKKMFLDGVAMAGTSGAIQFVVEQMQRGEMSERDIDLWISTLAFVSKPTKDTLVALLPLLDGKRMDTVLPVSAVVHTFCLQNEECGIKNEVRQIVEKIAGLLGNKCNGDKKKVMLALKALGNAGVSFEAENKLQACAQNTDLDIEMRVAAIQAYRRLSCEVMRSPIMDLYMNPEEDIEVRIAAFLNVMRCPSAAIIERVKNTMENEKIKQVGAFVMSYLRNIENKSPYKNEVRDIVNNVELLNKFESDVRKYSRNFQNYMYIDSLESGFGVDSNIIYNSKSFLPSNMMFNLTVDIMGTKVNMFQIDARAEGLDKMVEKMFGPEGYFRKDSESVVRAKKSISDNKIEKYNQKFDAKSNFEKDASLALDMKIFGNSLWYKKFQEGNVVSEAFSAMDIMVELAKEQETELTKSFLFLDTTIQIPTGSGMPLKLAINGSAVMNLKMSGKLDARNMENIDIHGKIQPSGAIQIATMMSVHGIVAHTGLKMVATLHSSTILDGLVEIRSGKVYQARLNMPRDQIEVIDVQSHIYLVNAGEEREQKSVSDPSTLYTQCTGFSKKPLGVELCGEMQLPSVKKNAPLYPVTGPARFRIFLRKTDPTLSSYNLELKWTEDKSGREVVGQHLVMSFNTPQSKIDREISAEFHLNKQDSTIAMKLKVPNKKFSFTGKRVMNEGEKRISMAVSVDDLEKFSMTGSLLADAMEGGIRYTPSLEIRGPTSRLLNVRSTLSLKNQKYSGDLSIEGLTATPVVMNGEMTMGERNRYELSGMIESYALSGKWKGHIQTRSGFSSRMNVQYRIMEGRKESLDVTCKVRDLSASGLIKYNGAVSLASSAMPEMSTALSWETQFTTGHIENTFDLKFGDGKIRRVQQISMSEILKYQGTIENNNIEGSLRCTYPEKDIDFAFVMNHKNTLESLTNNINLKYSPGKEATSTIDLKFNPRPLTVNGDIQVKYPGREMRLQTNVNKKSSNEYEATLTGQWQRGKQIRAVGNFRDSSNREGRNYQTTLEMTIPNTRPISLASQIQMFPGRYSFSADGDFLRGSYGVKGEYSSTTAWNHRAMALLKTPKVSYTAEGTLQKNGQVLTGKVDVNVPQYRRVTGTVEVSNGVKVKTGTVDIMWDVDRDQSKRVQTDVEYRLTADGSQGKFNLKSPVKTMSGSYNTNYAGQYNSGAMRGSIHTELEWENSKKVTMDIGGNFALKQSRRQVTGEIKISTPFADYDNMLFTVNHLGSQPEWSNKAVVQWKRNQRITFGTEGKIRSDSVSSFLDTNVKVNTPFIGYESMSLREVFERNPGEVSSTSMVQWATGKTMELSLSGKILGSNGIRAGANFTSPFSTLRDASMSFSNDFTRTSIGTVFDLRWNNRNSISVNFDGRNTMTGKKHICSSELQFTSTIPKYEKMSAKVVYNKDTKTASVNSDLRWSNKKVTVGFNGANRNSYYGYDMEGKMEYTSNFRNFEKGEIKLAHINDAQKFTSNIESTLPYSHFMNLKLQGNMPTYKEMDSSLTLSSSFVEGISYQVAYKVDGNRLAANGEASYGTQKMTGDLQGKAQVGHRAWDVDCKINVNTPIQGLEDMKMSFTQTRRENQITTRMQASKNQDSINVNHDIKVEDICNFVNNLRITTPFRNLRTVEINNRQTGKTGEYKHNTDATWGGKKATLSMELNKQTLRRGRNFEARLNAKSPFQTLSSLDIEIRHEDDERNYKPSFSMQWNEGNKIAVDGVLNNNRMKKVDTSLRATTSFPGYEALMFTGKYDVTGRQKTAEMSYKWNERSNKIVSVRGTLEADARNGMVDVILTTPIRGFESAQMKTDYAFSENEHSVNMFTKYGDYRYIFNGKHVKNNNGHEVNAQVSTPVYGYEKLSAFGSYAISKNDMSAEASYEWGNNKKFVTNADYKFYSGKMTTTLRVTTPFDGYKKMSLKVETNTQSPRKTGSLEIQWDPSKTVEVTGEFESDFSRFGNMNVQFRSPFENFKEVSMNGKVKFIPREYEAEATLKWMPNKKITGTVMIKPDEIIATVDSPFPPCQNVRFQSNLNKREDEAGVTASLEWGNTNKADISANYRLSDKTLEGKVEANIPYNGRKTYAVTGTLMNDKYKLMEGRVEVRTPEQRYVTSSLIRLSKENKEMTVSFEGPKTKVSTTGNFKIRNFGDLEGSLKMDSNALYVPSFSVKGSLKNQDWKNVRMEVSMDDVHVVTGTFKAEDRTYQIDASAESPSIPSKRVAVSLNANTKDINNMDCTLSLKVASQRHVFVASEKNTRRGFEADVKINSPAIRGQEMTMNVFYSNKKYQNIEGKVSIVENSKSHSLEFNFNNENNEITGNLNIQCEFVPSGRMTLTGKVSRPSDRILESSFAAEIGSIRHSLVANGKLLDSRMEMTVTLDSPAVSSRPITLLASLTNDNFKNIDGSISIKNVGGESRVAFNIRRNGWRELESFFTMNFPMAKLSMFRVDMKMKNDGLKSMEGSLDIQSSLEAMRSLSMTGKMKNTENAWDMSINFKLPVRKWDNISLLATVHKNSDLTRINPRITLSLPDKKYVVYANYDNSGNDVQAMIGSDWDDNKSELTLEKHSNEYRANLLTPFRGYENYNAVINFKNEKGKRAARIQFEDAQKRKYICDVNLNFRNLVNFNGEANIKLPFEGLSDVTTKLRQQLRSGRWTMNFDHNMERNKKVILSIEHDSNPLAGTIQIVTPLEDMKTLKMNYNWQASSNVNAKVEVELNNRNVLRLAVDQAYQADTRAYSKSIQVELPTLPYTVSLSTKPLPNGSELNIKSVLPKRSLNFQTMYQSSSTHFSHGTQLSLDERSGQTISYEIRTSPTQRRGSEFYARLNMPIRSLELRTTHEKTSTGRSMSGDFLWDAARDQTRHMKLAVEHVDNSNRYNVAHKLRMVASHPQLSKDVVFATEFLLSPTEIYGKTEIEYSRYQQHNIFLEARASNSAQSRRESRYTGSLIARHPVTNLDLKLTAEVANNQQEMAAQMQFNYLDRNLRQQIQELKTKIQKVKQEIQLMGNSNGNKLNLLGRMFHKDNELTIALEQTINNDSPIHSHFRWSQHHKNMELNVSSPNGDRIHVRAAIPEDHIEAEIGHTVSGRQYKDGKFYLGLKDSKILETRINWRPEVYSELQESLSGAYEHNMPKMSSAINNVESEISNEIDSKAEMLSRAVAQEMKPFVTEISKEMKKMRVDSQRAGNEIYQMYRRDEFFVRTAANKFDGAIETIRDMYYATLRYIAQRYEVFAETLSMSIQILNNILEGMVEDISRLYKSYQRSLAKWSKNISQLRKEYIDGLAEIVKNVALELADRLETAASAAGHWMQKIVVRYAPTLERYGKIYLKDLKNLISWLKENYAEQFKAIMDHPGYKALENYLTRVVKTMTEFQSGISYDQMVKSSRMFMSNGVQNMAIAYNYIREHPNINYMNNLVTSTFAQTRRIASELGMNTVAVNIVEELVKKTQNMAWNTIRDLCDEYTNFRENARVTYEPENGKIEVEMRMPVVRNSLKELLDVNSYPQIQKLREMSSQISFGDFCIWDTYYKYKRYLDINYWLPPFSAQAMIVGSQHYLTFDNFDFDFAGECSYLLARDFVDGNFTVSVNYIRDNNRVVKKSLNVFADGVKIEVSRDNKVTIDDRKVELPQQIGKTTITMEDGVITIRSNLDYTIKCNYEHDLSIVQLSGYYFGKTGGLFGTNNYEPALDMKTPENKIEENLEQFSNSWQVGNVQCTKKNMAEIAPVDRRAMEKCERLFKNYNSEFRSGFKQVDPEPFLRMCINDLSPIREAEQKLKICSSAAAYVESCRHEGVNLNMPKHCVRCERMNADHMESGDVVRITKDEPVRAADVVFIVEEKQCNKYAPNVLSKLAQSLEDGFKKSGHRQVHFAVVGFGGDGIFSEPHVVTSDSQVFGTVRNVDSALNSLPTGNGESNIFMALRYAAGLPFMTGSTKTFVLAKCSACKSEEMKADYSEMLRTMLDGDITLHLIMDHEFETRPNKPDQAKKVLGFDRKVAYTNKDMKTGEIRGDRDLLAQLKAPKDLCVPLAIEVNGSFFSMARLQDKRSANKKTVEVLSKRILKSAKPAECQICECIETQSGIGKSVCQRCVSPVVAKLVGDYMSPLMGYNYNDAENDLE